MRRRMWAAMLLLVLLVSALLLGCAAAGEESSAKRVQLVLSSRSTEYSSELYSGAYSAEQEWAVNLVTSEALYTASSKEQQNMLQAAMSGGADSIIIDPYSFGGFQMDTARLMQEGVEVIFLGQYEDAPCSATVSMDERQMGELIYKEAVRQKGEQPSILVLNCADTYGNTYRLRNAVRHNLKDTAAQVDVMDYSKTDARKLVSSLQVLRGEDNGVDILIALDAFSAKQAADVMRSWPEEERTGLFVFSSDAEMIQELEEGAVTAIVLRNYFALGYLAVEQAAALPTAPPKDVVLPVHLVHADNLFQPEMQKLLFPAQ